MASSAFKFNNDNIKKCVKAYGDKKKMDKLKIPPDLQTRIGKWDVSQVTDMSELFKGKKDFNEDLSDWNVSNVTNMRSMFQGAKVFNQPLNKWGDKVKNVTNMSDMFNGAKTFNQPLDKWNVSNVTSMSNMFEGAEQFNQELNDWDVSKLVNMSAMFDGAKAFNQPLKKWNVSNAKYMSGMFRGAIAFNQELNDWNVSNATIMFEMFKKAESFDRPLDNWTFPNIQLMYSMFDGATEFNQELNSWNVSNVTSMNSMFKDAKKFDKPLDKWNVSNVTNMTEMFKGALKFNQELNSWNVSNVTDIHAMFSGAAEFNQELNSWNVSSVRDMTEMFKNAKKFNQPLNSWNVSNVMFMTKMFNGAKKFNQQLTEWNIISVRNLIGMFEGATAYTYGPLQLNPANEDESTRFLTYVQKVEEKLQEKRNQLSSLPPLPSESESTLDITRKIDINTKLPFMLRNTKYTYKELHDATQKKENAPQHTARCMEIHDAFKHMKDLNTTLDILTEFDISHEIANFDKTHYRRLLLEWSTLKEGQGMSMVADERFDELNRPDPELEKKPIEVMIDYMIKSIDNRHYIMLELPFRFVNAHSNNAKRMWAQFYITEVIEAYPDDVTVRTFIQKYKAYKAYEKAREEGRNNVEEARSPHISCPNGITERAFLNLRELIRETTTFPEDRVVVVETEEEKNARITNQIKEWISMCFIQESEQLIDGEKMPNAIVRTYVDKKIKNSIGADSGEEYEKRKNILEALIREYQTPDVAMILGGGYIKVPQRYLPKSLTRKDRQKQRNMLLKSRRMYRNKHQYFTRKPVSSFHSKPSKHVENARRIYGVESIVPSKQLAKATGCSVDALQKIVKKGEGAYYSSGSRPNQTAQSWGYARLASAITAGKSAAVDYRILEKGCKHSGKAFRMAKRSRRKHGKGNRHTRRVRI